MKFLYYALLPLMLFGCTNRMYINPESGKIVKMTFENDSRSISTQTLMVFEKNYDCSDIKYLSFFGKPEFQKKFNVKLRKNYTISYSTTSNYSSTYHGIQWKSCGGMYTFPLTAGNEYLIKTNTDSTMCYFSIRQRSENGIDDWSKVEGVTKRYAHQPSWNDGPWCTANEDFKDVAEDQNATSK